MKFLQNILTVVIVFTSIQNTIAQEINTSIKLKIPVFEKTTIIVEPEYTQNDFQTYQGTFSYNTDIRFKHSKRFQTEIGSSFKSKIDSNKDNEFISDNGFLHFDIIYSFPKTLNDVKFQYRYRYQTNFEKRYIRSKLECTQKGYEYIEPYASAEVYYSIMEETIPKTKIKMGLKQSINKKFTIEEFFEIDTKIKRQSITNSYCLGLSLGIQL